METPDPSKGEMHPLLDYRWPIFADSLPVCDIKVPETTEHSVVGSFSDKSGVGFVVPLEGEYSFHLAGPEVYQLDIHDVTKPVKISYWHKGKLIQTIQISPPLTMYDDIIVRDIIAEGASS